MARRGIDISTHNGNIDLGALRDEINFVIIRVGYGTKGTIDDKFRRNADLCQSLGIPFGFYWYSYALDVNGAAQEAQHMINAIAPYKDSYSMGIWFDMEDADGYKRRNGMPSDSTLRAMCARFCADLEAAGYYTGIYASLSWFNNQLAGSELDRYDKWVAQWPTSGGVQKGLNVDPNSRSGWSIWQFTSEARFGGYNGRLDANYAYYDSYRIGEGTTPAPAPTPSVDGSTLDLATRVMQGEFGDGDARVNALGNRYNEVQDFINHIFGADIDTLADEVIAGRYGNGDQRSTVLGSRYDEVQNRVNEKLGGGSRSFQVGDKVQIKSSASRYATGQKIPNWVKGKTYTIQQMGDGKALLKEIISWVKTDDLQ